MTNIPLLDMENVSVRYGRHEVFAGLTLKLPHDQSSAVIGPNGSGKSTLLKLIFRDHYHDENEFSHFRVLGQKSRERDQLRMRMGLVSHELQSKVDKNSTVFDVVISQYYSSLATYAHQTYIDEQIETAVGHLEFMGISHLANSKFVGVSTGEQRRCLLARALIHDPEYLILDEPTSGLDIKATHQYLESMSTLIESGKKVVLVTHHLHEILPEIDYFVFLRNGELIAEGKRNKMLTNKKVSDLFEIPIKLEETSGFVSAHVISP
ncbi:MAG: ATP-binding cassette domain-containing protein [Acidiferrobacterales bacterium]|nr:ATP-binding cassette domain-containing protein [Acidiferrobacterales bacterium]